MFHIFKNFFDLPIQILLIYRTPGVHKVLYLPKVKLNSLIFINYLKFISEKTK